ncbi:MAG: glycosyltransferase [Bacteroidetes bacterium]|nr:glycosyltransferase [Bacteroidota bacterium]
MSKKFVTIFPICENVHLTKDLGQIPFFLHHEYGYRSSIVSYRNSKEYTNLNGEVKGLNIEFIENKGRISFLEKSVLSYIKQHAKEIDVLNLYIFSKFTFVYGILYKKLNPKGFLFLKLDGYNETFEKGYKIKHSTNYFKNIILKYLEKQFLKKVDLISIENTYGETLVKNKYPHIAHKVMYLPVGVNDHFLTQTFGKTFKSFEQKENIILTVGRIGEEIKNNKMMLRALAQTELKDWKMVFVGAINPEFQKFYNNWIESYPQLKDKLIFMGEIQNREQLYEWYNRAKIFCMTSWKESFCHSIGEALYFGNYIIGTEGIVSMPDLTDNGKYGVTLKADDDKAMAETLQKLINDPGYLKNKYSETVNYAHAYFTWSKIVLRIYQRIESN